MTSYAELDSCREFLLRNLRTEMLRRPERKDTTWIETERAAVAIAANQWGNAHGLSRTVTIQDVERLETSAVGHVNYAEKLCLYVCEYLYRIEGPQA
jgi:hypothetical protein